MAGDVPEGDPAPDPELEAGLEPDPSPGPLTRLDQRVVPRLQRGARRSAHLLGAPLRLLRRAEERAFPRFVPRVVRAWRVLALVAALIVLGGSAVHMERFPELRQAHLDAGRADQDPAVAAPPARGEVDPLDVSGRTVGPVRGSALDAYEAERAAALDELPDGAETAAVVSLEEYATAAEAAALVPDGLHVLRVQYRIPAEGERPQESDVTGDDLEDEVDTAIDEAVGPIEEEIREVETLLASGSVEDASFEADLERRLSELRAVRNLLEAAPAVVFALVVEGPVEDLRALAGRDDVRLVDPAPAGADAGGVTFYGLLPEDRDRASFGAVG